MVSAESDPFFTRNSSQSVEFVDSLRWVDYGSYKHANSYISDIVRETVTIKIDDTLGSYYSSADTLSYTKDDRDLLIKFKPATSIELHGKQNGIAVGYRGKGELRIDLNSPSSSSNRKISIDLSEAKSPYALLGDLRIAKTSGPSMSFSGSFGAKGIQGNVFIDTTTLGSSKLSFKENAGVDGNIVIKRGNSSFSFEGSRGGLINGKFTIEGSSTSTTLSNLSTISGGLNILGDNTKITFLDSHGGLGKYVGPISFTRGTTTLLSLKELQITGLSSKVFEKYLSDIVVNLGDRTSGVRDFSLSADLLLEANHFNKDVTFNFNNTRNVFRGLMHTLGKDSTYGNAKLNFVFNGTGSNSVIGTIKAESHMDSDNHSSKHRNIVAFNSGNNSIVGSVIAKTSNGAENAITFRGSGTALIDSRNSEGISAINGKNSIIFNNAGSQQILGEISASGNEFAGGINHIELSKSTASITGTIVSNTFGSNSIILKKGGVIIGNITASQNSLARNINSVGNSQNNIEFSEGNGKIIGNITSNSGTNIINFSGKDSNWVQLVRGDILAKRSSKNALPGINKIYFKTLNAGVEGDIIANGGENVIEGKDFLTVNGNIIATNGKNIVKSNQQLIFGSALTGAIQIFAGQDDNRAVNLIESGSLVQNSSSSELSIIAKQSSSASNYKLNYITMNNASNLGKVAEITANGSLTHNFLSFDTTSGENTLNVSTINASTEGFDGKSGVNHIGKNVIHRWVDSDGVGWVGINNEFVSNWSQSKFQALGSLNITGNLYTKSGTNLINFASISVGGDIDAEGGTNSVASNSLSVKNLKSRSGGTNNIVANTINISGSITAGGSTSETSTNTITLIGSNANFSMNESHSISIDGNGNNIFDFKDSTRVTSNLTTQRSSGTGKNIFNIHNGVTLTLSNQSQLTRKAIKTVSGETNVIFVGGNSTKIGGFEGNIQTSGGSTTVSFSNATGTYSIVGTISTEGTGSNVIDLSEKSAVFSGDLNFSGQNVSQEGGNIIKIGNGQSMTLGESTRNSINTTGGLTKIVFIGGTSRSDIGKLSANISTSGAGTKTHISFGDNGNKAGMVSLFGELSALDKGVNTFEFAHNLTLLTDVSSSLVLNGDQSGSNQLVFRRDAATVNIKNSGNSNSGSIKTLGGHTKFILDNQSHLIVAAEKIETLGNGETTIDLNSGSSGVNFKVLQNNTGTKGLIYSGGNSDNIGITNIIFKDGSSSTLTADIQTGDYGQTNFIFGTGHGVSEVTVNLDGKLTSSNRSISNFNIAASSVSFGYQDGLVFSQGINNINFNNSSGQQASTLFWREKTGKMKQIVTSGGVTNINFNSNGIIAGGLLTESGTTNINIRNNVSAKFDNTSLGGYGLSTSGGETFVNFENGGGKFEGTIHTAGNGKTTLVIGDNTSASIIGNIISDASSLGINTASAKTDLVFKGGNSAITLEGSSYLLGNLSVGTGNNIISLTNLDPNENTKRATRRELVIQNVNLGQGSLTFISQLTPTQADTIKIDGAIPTQKGVATTTYNVNVMLEDGMGVQDISTDHTILLASVKTDSGITFNKKSTLISGFTQGEIDLVTEINGDYTDYTIDKIDHLSIINSDQMVVATALTFNYDLYIANFNSLNKRMGELRENPYEYGVWARIFNGSQTNKLSLDSQSNYTTLQAGYDYAFKPNDANNYLGVALSYAFSISETKNVFDVNGQQRGVDNIYNNAIEVALYNSYVKDNGWYNDSIAKFSYLFSKFDIMNINSNTSTNNSSANFAFTLSNEVGYQFKFGEEKDWSITPHLEVGFGYFNQSNFKQTLQNSSSSLLSSADMITIFRSRVGNSVGYDFKRFIQDGLWNAKVYFGLSYEYDHVEGGKITMNTNQGVRSVANSNLSPDGRVVLNTGANLEIKDNTRMYFDFEKSFIGKIITDYQINIGVRYSFGNESGSAPSVSKNPNLKAPLKVEEEQESVLDLKK